MILEKKAISLAETKEILEDIDTEKSKKIKTFIKRFTKIKIENAKKLRLELEKLDLLKLNAENITKIIDFLPEDIDDIRRIFSGNDVNFSQEELNKIVEIVKKFN